MLHGDMAYDDDPWGIGRGSGVATWVAMIEVEARAIDVS